MRNGSAFKLDMRRQLIERVRELAERAYPDECCGLLVGFGSGSMTVTDVRPAENQAVRKRTGFVIDPQMHFNVLREIMGSDVRIIGHYHSHPNGRQEPSEKDSEMDHGDGAVWVIVPVMNGRSLMPKGYVRNPAGAGFIELPVETPV